MRAMISLAFFVSFSALALPDTMFTVKVVEEDGNTPVQGAHVRAGFITSGGGWMGTRRGAGEEKVTGSDGLVTFQNSSSGEWGYVITKDGYYRTSTGKPIRADGIDKRLFRDRWLPWNPTYVAVLRKIGTRVKGYRGESYDPKVGGSAGAYLTTPVKDQPVGYDLIARDWVIPYGLGTVSDFVLNVHQEGKYESAFEARMTLSFSEPGDGIQQVDIPPPSAAVSEFRWPKEAPLTGYEPQLVKFKKREKASDEAWTTNLTGAPGQGAGGHIFRVRSVMDDQGNVKEAMYGKIPGDFEVTWDGRVRFYYYLNPEHTRNLEFGENLFKGVFGPQGP